MKTAGEVVSHFSEERQLVQVVSEAVEQLGVEEREQDGCLRAVNTL